MDKDRTFFKELVLHHISGQLKVAPEHVSDNVLSLMRKSTHKVYEDFSKEFRVAEKVHTADFIHPVGSGYDLLYTPIKEFLEKLF